MSKRLARITSGGSRSPGSLPSGLSRGPGAFHAPSRRMRLLTTARRQWVADCRARRKALIDAGMSSHRADAIIDFGEELRRQAEAGAADGDLNSPGAQYVCASALFPHETLLKQSGRGALVLYCFDFSMALRSVSTFLRRCFSSCEYVLLVISCPVTARGRERERAKDQQAEDVDPAQLQLTPAQP